MTSKSSSEGSSIRPRGLQKRTVAYTKQSSIRNQGQGKGSVKQRLHPGMLSSQDRATAHYGAVTGLKVTEDGMCLLSAG